MAPRSARLFGTWVTALLVGSSLGGVLGETSGEGFCARAHAQERRIADSTRELVDIEQSVTNLRKVPLRGSDMRSPTYPQERLTDGELFFRLHDFIRASVILTDVVERFPKHAVYPDALYLLAESLFNASDYLGARAYYRIVLDHSNEPAFRSRLQGALARLIEIAIRIRNFDGIELYFDRLARLQTDTIEAATAYFRAKYLYNVAVPADVPDEKADPHITGGIDQVKLEASRVAFGQVDPKSQYGAQALYFMGVIYTLRGQYTPAIEQFTRVTALTPQDDAQRDVLELALLALGRLYYETDQIDRAVDAYQSIPRTSKRFETALFEIAWAFLRQGDSIHAERSLEVLSVAAPESQYIPDAQILRGNLLLRDGRYVAARQVFAEVVREFQPVRDQLDQLIARQPDAPAYFRGLVRQGLQQFDEGAFLPPLALRWARIDGDMKRAVEAVRDLSQARQLTAETSSIVTRLNAALSGRSRVNMFPDLRAQREDSLGLRNRLAQLRTTLIRADEEQTAKLDSLELASVRARRRELERLIAGLPTKGADFNRRNSSSDERFLVLGKQLSSLEVQLQGLESRIVAIEFYLNDVGPKATQPANVTAYRTELESHRTAVAQQRALLAQLKQELETSRLQVGLGDASYLAEDARRAEYNQLVQRERQLNATLGGAASAELDKLFQRANVAESALDARDREIDATVDERAADMQRVIAEESGKLVGYRQALTGLGGETEEVVGGLSLVNYKQVQQRFYDVVLKADVGTVDVGWAEREEHRLRIESLTRERVRSAQALDDEFKEIMEDRGKP